MTDESFISGSTTLIQEFNNGRLLLHTFYVKRRKERFTLAVERLSKKKRKMASLIFSEIVLQTKGGA